MLLEYTLAVRQEAARESMLQEAMGEGEERVLISAPDMVKETLGEDEGV